MTMPVETSMQQMNFSSYHRAVCCSLFRKPLVLGVAIQASWTQKDRSL